MPPKNKQPRVQSDTNKSDAEELLLKAKARSYFLERFNDNDVNNLATYLNVLSFSADEAILKKGETASWVGIILSGELGAFVDGNLVGTMGTGTIVGEMAFFTGGERMADVNGVAGGFIALMMTHNLIELLEAAPMTGCKLVRALGTSALSQLAYNPRLPTSKALDWASEADGGGPSTGLDECRRWAEEAFEEVEELTADDFSALVKRMKCRRFVSGETLIHRFSATRDTVCFLLQGRVELRISGQSVREVDAGSLLHDMRFFEPSLLPYDVVATDDGLLAGVETDRIDELAKERPLLALCLMRMLGGSAVENVLGGLLTSDLHPPGEAPLVASGGVTGDSPTNKRRSSLAQSMIRKKDGAKESEGEAAKEANEPRVLESAGASSDKGAGGEEGGKKLTILSGALKKKKKLAGAMPSASAEIFYLAKAAKQAKEAEDALALSDKLLEEKQKAQQSNRNSAMLTAKANRQSEALQEKLEASSAEKQSLLRQIRNLKVELLQSTETEEKMSRVALEEKRKTERAVNELVAAQVEMGELRAKIEAYESGDPTAKALAAAEKELKIVRAQAEEAVEAAAAHEEARDRLAEEVADMQRALAAEKKRSAERASQLTQMNSNDQAATKLKDLLRAAQETAQEATKKAEDSTAKTIRTAMEAKKEMTELKEQQTSLIDKNAALATQVRHQQLGAKALGMLYLTRLAALRKQLKKAGDRAASMERELINVPRERAKMEEQNLRHKREAADALAAVEPLRAEMTRDRQELRQQAVRLERLDSTSERLLSTRRVNAELRATNEELLEHVRFLTRSLSETQSRTDAMKGQLEDKEGLYTRALAKRDNERRALELQLAEVVSRVREHEKAFLGEQPMWLIKEMKDSARDARDRGRERSPRLEPPPPPMPPMASSQTPSPRWGVALPTVHAASMPVRPSFKEPPQAAYQGPSPRNRKRQQGLQRAAGSAPAEPPEAGVAGMAASADA